MSSISGHVPAAPTKDSMNVTARETFNVSSVSYSTKVHTNGCLHVILACTAAASNINSAYTQGNRTCNAGMQLVTRIQSKFYRMLTIKNYFNFIFERCRNFFYHSPRDAFHCLSLISARLCSLSSYSFVALATFIPISTSPSSDYPIEMAYIDIYELCATRGGGR